MNTLSEKKDKADCTDKNVCIHQDDTTKNSIKQTRYRNSLFINVIYVSLITTIILLTFEEDNSDQKDRPKTL